MVQISPLNSISLEEAQEAQFRLVDTITKHFNGNDILSTGDLGVRKEFNKPSYTKKIEDILADYFQVECAKLVRGAGTGALRFGFMSFLKPNDKLLIHSAPVYPTSKTTLDAMGINLIEVDFHNQQQVESTILNNSDLKGVLIQHTRQKIDDSYSSSVLVFDKNELKNYGMKVDVKETFNPSKGTVAQIAKKVPVVGMIFSGVTNSGEFFSDENKHKSGGEKTGRFVAGLGLDAGVAGVTTAGAAIGTMICPGVGTIIGGAVGAGVGIVGSWLAEDTVKDWGESAGRWVEDRAEDAKEFYDDAKDWVSEKTDNLISGAGDFISGIFN